MNSSQAPEASPERVRLAWGRRGIAGAVERGDAVIIVDVLSFSSAVVAAVNAGGRVRPCVSREQAVELANREGGAVAVGRAEVPERGRFSLSPLTYLELEPGQQSLLVDPPHADVQRWLSTQGFSGRLPRTETARRSREP